MPLISQEMLKKYAAENNQSWYKNKIIVAWNTEIIIKHINYYSAKYSYEYIRNIESDNSSVSRPPILFLSNGSNVLIGYDFDDLVNVGQWAKPDVKMLEKKLNAMKEEF
jgi:hypothetical protein